MEIPNWTLYALTPRDTFEAMIRALGGPALAEQQDLQRAAREVLEGALTADQRALYLSHADARADADAAREDAATRVALTVGVAVGAALVRFPAAPADALARAATGVVRALLGAGLHPDQAAELTQTVLNTLARASEGEA